MGRLSGGQTMFGCPFRITIETFINLHVEGNNGRENSEGGHSIGPWLPRPTMQFRLRAWQAFQRLLDPFAPPKPLRRPHKH